MERYEVQGKQPHCLFIADALEDAGCTILEEPDPSQAPFLFLVKTPEGDKLTLICYAFTANKYEQGGRPSDEHRFQIKYGSDFSRYHDIFISDDPSAVTLFFGIHFDEEIVVACDPAMHKPTWFSKSVEFKTHHVHDVQDHGWHVWERQRKQGRRKRPLLSLEDEVIVGLTPEFFLDYVLAERVTTGTRPGHRFRALAHWHDEPMLRMAASRGMADAAVLHALEEAYGLSALEILDVIEERNRLQIAVRGGVAERHLLNALRSVDGLEVEEIDEDGRPDFRVRWAGTGRWTHIECKVCGATRYQDGSPKADVQRTRAPRGFPCGRYYSPTEFEILAVCLHPITGDWEFAYADTATLPEREDCPGRINNNVRVRGPGRWEDDLVPLLVG